MNQCKDCRTPYKACAGHKRAAGAVLRFSDGHEERTVVEACSCLYCPNHWQACPREHGDIAASTRANRQRKESHRIRFRCSYAGAGFYDFEGHEYEARVFVDAREHHPCKPDVWEREKLPMVGCVFRSGDPGFFPPQEVCDHFAEYEPARYVLPDYTVEYMHEKPPTVDSHGGVMATFYRVELDWTHADVSQKLAEAIPGRFAAGENSFAINGDVLEVLAQINRPFYERLTLRSMGVKGLNPDEWMIAKLGAA